MTGTSTSEIKVVGKSGQISLGKRYAGKTLELQRHTGFNWDAIRHIRTPNGATAYSLRLSGKIRGIAYRDGDFLRIISLHPDHEAIEGVAA
jgi:hypothetical protein